MCDLLFDLPFNVAFSVSEWDNTKINASIFFTTKRIHKHKF